MQLYRLPSSSTDASNSGLLRLLNDPDPLLLGKIAMDWWQTPETENHVFVTMKEVSG
jgi:hypothetical protein